MMLQNCTVIANLFSIKFWSGIIRPVVAEINPFSGCFVFSPRFSVDRGDLVCAVWGIAIEQNPWGFGLIAALKLIPKMRVTFVVEQDEETGVLTASWDDPNGGG